MSSNVTIVDYAKGGRACLSYHVPVAIFVPGLGYVQTATKYSQTTSRHANQFTGRDFKVLPDDEFRALLAHIQGHTTEAKRKLAAVTEARLHAAAPALLIQAGVLHCLATGSRFQAMTVAEALAECKQNGCGYDDGKAIADATGVLTMDWGTLPDEVTR